MSRETDERIVNLQFNNKEFEAHAKTSMSTLDKLKEKLQFKNASTGIKKMQQDINNFTMAPINNAIGTVEARISTLQLVWANSLSNMINKAVNAGTQMSKALTTDQIKTGFREYEQLVNATQTIWANTKDKGTNLDEINKALDELNRYADQTIYNFTQMTNNIGRFTAAGVDLNTSVTAIKGISNLAAVSGASAEDASRAMYQLSQAMASGTIKLMDWNSVVNANMGGQGFQNKLTETAREMGKAVDEAIKKQGSFRESLAEGWLTTDVLVKTLEKYTDTTTEFGQTATDAATKVKTFTQMWDVLKESVQSGWSESFRTIVGDFEEARNVLTKLTNAITNFIAPVSEARNGMIKLWAGIGTASSGAEVAATGLKALNIQMDGTAKFVDKETGFTGREMLIVGLGLALQKVAKSIILVKNAFASMFPPITAKTLVDLSKRFMNFMSVEKYTSAQTEQIKTVFKGIGAALHIGIQLIDAIIFAIKQVWQVTAPIRQVLLNIAEEIANFLILLDKFLSKTQLLKKIVNLIISVLMLLPTAIRTVIKDFEDFVGIDFSKLFENVVNSVLQFVYNVVVALNSFQKAPTKGVDAFMETIKEKFKPFTFLANTFKTLVGIFKTAGKTIGAIAVTFIETIKNSVGNMENPLKSIFTLKNGVDVSKIVMNSSVVVLMVSLIKTVKDLKKKLAGFGEIGTSIKKLIMGITGVFTEVQNSLKANVLIKIAVAIGIITASMLVLASIREDKLVNSMVALTEIITGLVLSIKVLNGVDSVHVGGVMIGLTTTLLSLMTTVVALSFLNKDNMNNAVTYVIELLLALAAFTRIVGGGIDKNLKGVGPTLIAVSMSFQMIASSMVAIGALVNIMDPDSIKYGALMVAGVFIALIAFISTLTLMQAAVNKTMNGNNSAWKGLPSLLLTTAISFQIIGTTLAAVMVVFTATAAIFDHLGDGVGKAIKSFIAISVVVGALLLAIGKVSILMSAAKVKGTQLLALAATFTVVVALLNSLIPLFIVASLMKTSKLAILGATLVLLANAIIGITLALGKFTPVFKTTMILLAVNTVAIALIISSITNLVSALVSLASINTSKIQTNLAEISTAVYNARQEISLGVSGLIEAVAKGIERSAATICTSALNVINTVMGFLQSVAAEKLEILLGIIVAIITALVNKLAEAIPPLMEAAVKLIVAIVIGLTKGMQDHHDQIVEAVSAFVLELASIFIDVVDVMVDTGKGIISNFVSGVLEQIGIDNDRTVKAVSDFVGRVLMPFAGISDFIQGETSGVGGLITAALNVRTTAAGITGTILASKLIRGGLGKAATQTIAKAGGDVVAKAATQTIAKATLTEAEALANRAAIEVTGKAAAQTIAKAGEKAIFKDVAVEVTAAGGAEAFSMATLPVLGVAIAALNTWAKYEDKKLTKLQAQREKESAGKIANTEFSKQDIFDMVANGKFVELQNMYSALNAQNSLSESEEQLMKNIESALVGNNIELRKSTNATKSEADIQKDANKYYNQFYNTSKLSTPSRESNKDDYLLDKYGGYIKKSDIDQAINLAQTSKGINYLKMLDENASVNKDYIKKLEEFTDLSKKDIAEQTKLKEDIVNGTSLSGMFSSSDLYSRLPDYFSNKDGVTKNLKIPDIQGLIDSISDTSALDTFKSPSNNDAITEMYNKIFGDNSGLPTGEGSDAIYQVGELGSDVANIANDTAQLNDSFAGTIEPYMNSMNSYDPFDDTAVVGAIDALAGDIDALNAALFGMNIVLDSGALVGSLTGDIDSALATRYKYARRGV